MEEVRRFIGNPVWTWNENDYAWYKIIKPKTLRGFKVWVLFVISALFFVNTRFIQAKYPDFSGKESVGKGKLLVTYLLGGINIFVLYFNLIHLYPPLKTSNIYQLLKFNNLGQYAFLTVNILTSQFYYWLITIIYVTLNFFGFKYQKILKNFGILSYSMCTINTTLAIIMGLLFMRFVYFNKKWRSTSLNHQIKKRLTNFGEKALFQHLVQIPCCLLDITFVKNHDLLERYTLSYPKLVFILLLFTFVYYFVMRLDFVLTKQSPYDFLDKIIGYPVKEAMLLSGVVVFGLIVALIVHGLAISLLHLTAKIELSA